MKKLYLDLIEKTGHVFAIAISVLAVMPIIIFGMYGSYLLFTEFEKHSITGINILFNIIGLGLVCLCFCLYLIFSIFALKLFDETFKIIKKAFNL